MPLFSAPKMPPPPPAPPPIAHPATSATSNVVAAGANNKARSAVGATIGGVNPTGASGLIAPPSSSGKTLLGE